jgi:MFS family permease
LFASQFAPRDVVVVVGAAIAVAALLLSLLFVRDTAAHVALEQRQHPAADGPPKLREAFARVSFRVPALRSCSQAGLVNNLNDALAWGLVPLFLAAHGRSVAQVGLVAAVYPAVWASTQIATGAWSDKVGRKPLIVAGMLLQGVALGALALSGGSVAVATVTAASIGLGTALVYPTLIAAMSDAVSPVERAPIVGVYRFWRDSGYAFGGLIAGAVADALGYGGAIAIVAALTVASGLWVLIDMPARVNAAADRPKQPSHKLQAQPTAVHKQRSTV